jgi:hypothetical protein
MARRGSAFIVFTVLLAFQAIAADSLLTTGSAQAALPRSERPVGSVDGMNRVFTLHVPPAANMRISCFKNGFRQRPSLDYDVTGQVLTFTAASLPHVGDSLMVLYSPVHDDPSSAAPAQASARAVQSGLNAKSTFDQTSLALVEAYSTVAVTDARSAGRFPVEHPTSSSRDAGSNSNAIRLLLERSAPNPAEVHASDSESEESQAQGGSVRKQNQTKPKIAVTDKSVATSRPKPSSNGSGEAPLRSVELLMKRVRELNSSATASSDSK